MVNKRDDVLKHLASRKVACSSCNTVSEAPAEILVAMWSHLVLKNAALSNDDKRMLHLWHQGKLQGDTLITYLCKFDRQDLSLQAHTVHNPHYFQELAQGTEQKRGLSGSGDTQRLR